MYRRILVPLDGTRFGDQALPPAIDIAVRTGASIELVHVHRYTEREGMPSAMPQYQFQHVAEADARYDASVMDLERRALEETAADIELRYPVEVRTRVLTGRTADAILGEAGDIVADLVVLSSHARSGLERLRHGSVAHSLLAHLNVPTLCVHPVGEDTDVVSRRVERVLIPLDGSPFSEQILEAMGPLLAALKAQPALVHVVAPRPFLGSGTDDTYRIIVNREQALNYLHDVADRWRGRMPEPVLLAFEDAQPASLIAGLLSVGDYDMVAMATHGRGGLSAMIMGSVANDVLAASHVPILLYRPRSVPLPGLASVVISGDSPDART
ncbi:MAG TPA: universal stress protein [Longimicrobiales bacterium]|nr:universal stress protein [Longimicrobiales bacterium]